MDVLSGSVGFHVEWMFKKICWFSCRVDVLGRSVGFHVEWMF